MKLTAVGAVDDDRSTPLLSIPSNVKKDRGCGVGRGVRKKMCISLNKVNQLEKEKS